MQLQSEIVFAQADLMRLVRLAGLLALLLASSAMAQAPTFQPLGTVRQVMLGIVKPTSDVVFKFQFEPPKTAAEWATLQNNCLNLAEAGNLLLLPGRAKDKSMGEERKSTGGHGIASVQGRQCQGCQGAGRDRQ
jgi:hypothetical protein